MVMYFKTLVKWAFGPVNSKSTRMAMDDWLIHHKELEPIIEPCKHENWSQSGLTNHGTCHDCGIQFYFYNNPDDGITYYKIIDNKLN